MNMQQNQKSTKARTLITVFCVLSWLVTACFDNRADGRYSRPLSPTTNINQPSSHAQQRIDEPAPFDVDVGSDASWAAEKKLIGLFKEQGLIMRGQPYEGGVERAIFERASDGAQVNYAYVRPTVHGEPAHYKLSASVNSPGFKALVSVAEKVSRDRLSTINEAVRESTESHKAVVKQHGDFNHRGDFRVRADETTLELDNLWKGKGM